MYLIRPNLNKFAEWRCYNGRNFGGELGRNYTPTLTIYIVYLMDFIGHCLLDYFGIINTFIVLLGAASTLLQLVAHLQE